MRDSCTIGVPNDEWGEEVKTVIELKDGIEPSDELAKELIAYARERLAHFKCPKTHRLRSTSSRATRPASSTAGSSARRTDRKANN